VRIPEKMKIDIDDFDCDAVKFQRLMQGVLLLTAVLFQWMLLVYLTFLIMLVGVCYSPRYAPFAFLYYRFLRPIFKPVRVEEACPVDLQAERFACTLGTSFLALAIVLNYYGYQAAWIFVGVVAALSLLAGTVGFCLGSLIYTWLRLLSARMNSRR
jgi:hypothetical protein